MYSGREIQLKDCSSRFSDRLIRRPINNNRRPCDIIKFMTFYDLVYGDHFNYSLQPCIVVVNLIILYGLVYADHNMHVSRV